MAAAGQFVWYDLMTTDLKAATAFYSETVGWKTKFSTVSDPDKPYLMWLAGDQPVGGLMDLPEEAAKMGAPPHWLSYVAVDDVDGCVAKATKLGGRVYQPGMDIPNVGRIAILADPQGATFALYKPTMKMGAPDTSKLGAFSWAELNSTDYESGWTFYQKLFGWKHRSTMDMGGGAYFMFNDATEVTKGGMSNMAKLTGAPAHWLQYVNVDDCDAAAKRIENAGGKILNGPMEIPGNDRIPQCQDPQGAAFAIYSEGKR